MPGSYGKSISPWEQPDWENMGVSNIHDLFTKKIHGHLLRVGSELGVPEIILVYPHSRLIWQWALLLASLFRGRNR